MKKQTCLAGGGYGIPLLSVAAQLLATGMLVVTAFIAVGQTQLQSSQPQPESVVAVVADALGLPSVPADQLPPFGTYWKVQNSHPCVTAPLPFLPHDPSLVVYAIGGGQFLVDETDGQLVSSLPSPHGQTALGAADYAAILQGQVHELQSFVAHIQAAQLNAQSSRNGQMSALGLDRPSMSPEDCSDITLDGPIATTNDLWLQILSMSVTNGTANLVIHPPWNVTNGVYELLYCTNLAPPVSWQWLLRTDPGQTNLIVSNAAPAQGFYRLGVPIGSAGTNFWLAFPSMYVYDSLDLSLYISSSVAATGTVSIPGLGLSQSFSVGPGAVGTIAITNDAMFGDYDVVGTNGIHVISSQPVSIVAVNFDYQCSASFNCLPVTFLGTNYCVMARPTLINADGCYSQLAIVATADNTTVSITPSATANLVGHSGFYQVTNLMQGETYQIRSSEDDYTADDVTGTWVSSDKPIVVLAGASCAFVPDTNSVYANPLVQEQLPLDTWGTEALALSFAGKTGGDSYRVLAAANNTVVFTNGVVAGTNQAGRFLDLILDGPVEFRASQPIQVAQFAKGGSFDDWEGDPCEILLPRTGRYLQTNIVFTLPYDYTTGDFDQNYLNIIVPESALTNTLVDGSAVAPANFIPIGTSGYYGAQIAVTNDVHGATTHTVTSSQPVGVQVYGFGLWDSYGYCGGLVR